MQTAPPSTSPQAHPQSQPDPYAEDEIDLRPYIAVLLRQWKLIVGTTVLFAVVAAGLGMMQPTMYQAEATVAVSAFGVKPVPDVKVYIELATSDEVLGELSKQMAATGTQPVPDTVSLRAATKAVAGADPSLVKLQYGSTDPQKAAKTTTIWAGLFATAADTAYNANKVTLSQLDTQLKMARDDLAKAEQEVTTLEMDSKLELLQADLTSQRSTLSSLYASKVAMQSAAESADSLLNRLRAQDPKTAPSPNDDTAIMLMQASILGTSTQIQLSTGMQNVPAQSSQTTVQGPALQIQTPDQQGRTIQSQIDAIQGILTLVSDRTREADKRIATIQSTIVDLQSRVAKAQGAEAPILSRRDNLRAQVKELDLKASQARASIESGLGAPRVIGEAQVPTGPMQKGTTRTVATAAMLGLAVGALFALAKVYMPSIVAGVSGISSGSGHRST